MAVGTKLKEGEGGLINMRYWAWFGAKLAVAGVVFWRLFVLIARAFPSAKGDPIAPLDRGPEYLLCDICMMVWFLLAAGALYLVMWDQRYRCRVCLRWLRMPVETGSWSRILQLGRPRIEYICPYGHGTLREDELRISGSASEWEPHSADFWAELCASSKTGDER